MLTSIDVKFTFDSARLGLFSSLNILQIADVANFKWELLLTKKQKTKVTLCEIKHFTLELLSKNRRKLQFLCCPLGSVYKNIMFCNLFG